MNKKINSEISTVVTMSTDEAKTICRLGKGSECCAFLVMSPSGFECIKWSYPMNTTIGKRLEAGTMNAKGEGGWEGCAWELEQTQ